MADHEVVRVFVGPEGAGGNPLGVVYDGSAVPGPAGRQRLAAQLGFSETVFIDDPDRGEVDIYLPGGPPGEGRLYARARGRGLEYKR